MVLDKIPEGSYCYEPVGWDGNIFKINVCPFWKRKNEDFAMCTKFNIDDEKAGTLLWDMVKECGENYGD